VKLDEQFQTESSINGSGCGRKDIVGPEVYKEPISGEL